MQKIPFSDDGGREEQLINLYPHVTYQTMEGFGGKLKECFRKRWAEYICQYIEEYRNRGFHVTMLTLQNEPKAVQPLDSCVFTAQEEKNFLRDFM